MIKKKIIDIILVILLLVDLAFFISLLIINVKVNQITQIEGYNPLKTSGTDLDYNIQDNHFSVNNSPIVSSTSNFYNKIYNYTDFYNATYDFNNETIGIQNTAIGFCDDVDLTGTMVVDIVGVYEKHDNIIRLHDDGAGSIKAYNYIANITSGTIQFWFASDDVSYDSRLVLRDHGTTALYVRFNSDLIGGTSGNIHNANDDTWYNIRIDFECGAGGYLSLGADEMRVWINNISYGVFSFTNPATQINAVLLNTPNAYSCNFYFDAIGYSWSGYQINSNLFSYSTEASGFQTFAYEFAYDTDGTFYPTGTDNPSTWTDIESGGYDGVNVEQEYASAPDRDYDRVVLFYYVGATLGKIGLEKDDFAITHGYLNITWSWQGLTSENAGSEYNLTVYSYDLTKICEITIYDDSGTIELRANLGGYTILLDDNFNHSSTAKLRFNLFIGDLCVLRFNDGTQSQIGSWQTFVFDKMINKHGLGKVECFSKRDDTSGNWLISTDYIGVFVNGTSLSNDYIVKNYNTNEATGGLTSQFNILEYDLSGNCSFGFTSGLTSYTIAGFTDYGNSTFKRANLYDKSWSMSGASFRLVSKEPNCSLNSYDWYGVKMSIGAETIYPNYEFTNLEANISYFYVSGGNLHYIANYTQDGILEQMSIEFDISNVLTVNRSVDVDLYYNSIGYSEFRVNYTDDTSSVFEYKSYTQHINNILPQSKIVDSFYLLVNDGNENTFTNQVATGYLSDISLIYVSNIGITITTTNIITLMIPLIVILVPTLVLAKRYGKQIILPMVFLMVIILFITDMIPVWLFFLFMFGFGALIFLVYRDKITNRGNN